MKQPILIESDETYYNTLVSIYYLMNKGEANLAAEELGDLEVMALAVEKYEDELLYLKP